MFRALLRTDHRAENQSAESEERRPHRLRRMLIRYTFAGVAVLAVEMLLVGRWLFVVPLLAAYITLRWGTRWQALCAWIAVLLMTAIPALFGWWWPVWWKIDADLVSSIYIVDTWHAIPPVLMLTRWLLALVLPLAWYIPTALAYTRYAIETLLPEFPNVTPLEALRSWAIWHSAQPEPEEQESAVIPYMITERPSVANGHRLLLGDFPLDIVKANGEDDDTAAQTLEALFDALLSGADYTRHEIVKRRKLISQDAWNYKFSPWMRDNGHAVKLPGNTQKITRGGLAMMEDVLNTLRNGNPPTGT